MAARVALQKQLDIGDAPAVTGETANNELENKSCRSVHLRCRSVSGTRLSVLLLISSGGMRFHYSGGLSTSIDTLGLQHLIRLWKGTRRAFLCSTTGAPGEYPLARDKTLTSGCWADPLHSSSFLQLFGDNCPVWVLGLVNHYCCAAGLVSHCWMASCRPEGNSIPNPPAKKVTKLNTHVIRTPDNIC